MCKRVIIGFGLIDLTSDLTIVSTNYDLTIKWREYLLANLSAW